MKRFSQVFVYLRFSSDAQADGNSFARQRELAQAYLSKQEILESQVEWVEDPALSAFHGDHIKSGALGRLLGRVRDKSVSNGLLIFESVDRASRQGSMPLLSMLSEFLDAGFSVHFLDQPEVPPFDNRNPPPFLGTMLSMKADLARLESSRKSGFSRSNWDKRRHLARTENQPFTRECPRWLDVIDNKYVVNHALVESIHAVFKLAKDGWGVSKIIRHANIEKLPVPATGETWHTSLLNRLFSNRALIGEFQPHSGSKKNKKQNGDAIRNLFPVVIDENLFFEVRGLRDKAAAFPNRRDENNYNYLMGIGRCACGATWRRLNKNSGKQIGYAQYSCANRQRGVTNCPNLPGKTFDFFFIGAACAKIPSLLSVVDGKRVAKKLSLEQKMLEVERRISKLMDLIEYSDESYEEVVPRLQRAKVEKEKIKDEIKAHERFSPPEGDFEFGDAVTVFLPAFLNHFPDGESDEAKNSFRSRALFRARILQSVESVVVSISRDSYTVTLKNGISFIDKIEEIEFTTQSEFTESELEEMKDARALATAKMFGD